MKKDNRSILFRVFFYLLGLLVLALGLTLNTKTGLGVSPIISVAYSVSTIFDHNFGNVTLGLYCIFVLIEMILHLVRSRRAARKEGEALAHANKTDSRLVLLMDVLQIPLSLVFTRFLNVFSAVIPDLCGEGKVTVGQMTLRVMALVLAVILTGIGAAMSLNMRIIPNPGDGIVQAIADCVRKEVGFTKNCVDVVNILISTFIGLFFAGHLAGVGIGTILAVIGGGRVISVFNRLFYEKMNRLACVEV